MSVLKLTDVDEQEKAYKAIKAYLNRKQMKERRNKKKISTRA